MVHACNCKSVATTELENEAPPEMRDGFLPLKLEETVTYTGIEAMTVCGSMPDYGYLETLCRPGRGPKDQELGLL